MNAKIMSGISYRLLYGSSLPEFVNADMLDLYYIKRKLNTLYNQEAYGIDNSYEISKLEEQHEFFLAEFIKFGHGDFCPI